MKTNEHETNGGGFDICPGKYFDRIVFTAVDKRAMPPYGGDTNALIWRREGTDDWILSFRTRRYSGPDSDPFTGGDQKAFSEYRGDLHRLREAADEITRLTTEILGGKVLIHDTIKIEGDWKAFEDRFFNNPPAWAHTKTVKMKANQ